MYPLAKRALPALLFVALSAPLARGQHAHPTADTLSLSALLADLAATPAVRAARLEGEALAAEARQAAALPDPTIALTAYPAGTPMGQRAEVRAEQMVPFPGKRRLRRELGSWGARAAEAEADALLLDLTLEVKEAYIELYRAQQVERLVREFRDRVGAFTEATAVRYEVGRGPQGAILMTQVERGRLDERLLDLDLQRHHAQEMLARLLDRPGLAVAPVALTPPPLPTADADLAALARRLRPEVRALEAERGRAETLAALARRERYPDFGVHAMFMEMGPGEMENASGKDAFGVGVSVQVPLWRGRLRAMRDEAEVRARQADARLEALETTLATEASELLYHARHEREVVALYRDRLIPQARLAAESALTAYTTGGADFLTLLDAERTLFDLRMAYEEARARALTATAELERVLGLPPGTDLSDPDALPE